MRSKALVVAYAVHESGRREVIGIDIGETEPARCWSASQTTSPRSPSCLRRPRRIYRLPRAHWPKLRSTNPLERVNREIGRRSDVVGIFPKDAAAIRLAGALLIEQNDEWLVGRRYLSAESIALALEGQGDEGAADNGPEEVPRLQPA